MGVFCFQFNGLLILVLCKVSYKSEWIVYKVGFMALSLFIIRAMVGELWSIYPEALLESTTKFRKLLSLVFIKLFFSFFTHSIVISIYIKHDPPIHKVIKDGHFEAAWALTNIASGISEHTRVLIQHSVVPKLVQLLSSGNDDVPCRYYVLSQGAMVLLLSQFCKHPKESILRTATNSYRCLLVTVAYLKDIIEALIEAGVCSRFVNLLLHPSPIVYTLSLRTIGHSVAGNDEQTQVLIDYQVLSCFHQLLTQNYSKNI
ncbi:hypothetical protein MKX03_034452, partial [Papaver bracteatum]